MVSNFTRQTAREITYNNFEISLVLGLNITHLGFVISRFFSVYSSVTSRRYIFLFFFIKIVFF